ncbi:MAG: GAF domain-containing protein [Terrabacter sp.]
MEPTPETDAALTELESYGDGRLREDLRALVDEAKRSVPELVGVSVGLLVEDLVLTYVASDLDTALLDAMQYLDTGPCVRAAEDASAIVTGPETLFDEEQWRLFAQATASHGVRSTLSMPFVRNGVVTGAANFYGSGDSSFEGHVEMLARLFGAWSAGATHNADLQFRTRHQAARSVANLRASRLVDQAIGVLVAEGVADPNEAEARLRQAAAQAGVPVEVLSRALIDTYANGGGDPQPPAVR